MCVFVCAHSCFFIPKLMCNVWKIKVARLLVALRRPHLFLPEAMAEFFSSLTQLRQGQPVASDVIERARKHCQGGRVVRDLCELYEWMRAQNPEMPYFDNRIASGQYPTALAAFVTSSSWDAWMKHAVYALHGEMYLQRLQCAKSMMRPETYRDHVAGASMHRANGYAHMARAAGAQGLAELTLPTWDAPRTLGVISAQAVADLRVACTLRSEKYGSKSGSDSSVKAYQAALRNMADALQIHSDIVPGEGGNGEAHRMAGWLRERATNLALTDQRLLVACDAGEALGTYEQRLIARDLRLAETAAARSLPRTESEEERTTREMCARCAANPPTHLGFSCRCLCLCEDCASHEGGRVLECPICGDFTEFVRR